MCSFLGLSRAFGRIAKQHRFTTTSKVENKVKDLSQRAKTALRGKNKNMVYNIPCGCDLVMSRLSNLKGKEEYKGISVTDDHSVTDRKFIREWEEKAKAANGNEPAESLYEWKVGGSRKNGMQLKKLCKRTPFARSMYTTTNEQMKAKEQV